MIIRIIENSAHKNGAKIFADPHRISYLCLHGQTLTGDENPLVSFFPYSYQNNKARVRSQYPLLGGLSPVLEIEDIAFGVGGAGTHQKAGAGDFVGDDFAEGVAAVLLHDIDRRCYIFDLEGDVA